MSKKIKSPPPRKAESRYHVLTKGRGFLKIEYKPDADVEIFSMAFGRLDKYVLDNGRILGYDTKHAHDHPTYGPCHRHYLSNKTAFHLSKYQDVLPIFERQWQEIDNHFKTNVTLDTFILN